MSFFRSLVLSNTKNLTRFHIAGNRRTFTIAHWVKKLGAGDGRYVWFGYPQTGPVPGGIEVQLTSSFIQIGGLYSSYYFQVRSTAGITDNNWHHVVCAIDTTQTTASNRVRLYLDGSEVSYSIQNYPYQYDLYLNANSAEWNIGKNGFDLKIDEFYFIDGYQLTPSSFITGTPGNPKVYAGPYGNKGFLLNFEDNTSAASLGYDVSGNANHFTCNGISLADSTTDVPGLTLIASDLAVGAPVLGTPDFTAGIAALELAVGSPELGTPALTALAINQFVANDLAVTQPTFGSPFFLAYEAGSLGVNWNKTAATRIGVHKLSPAGEYDAVVMMDTNAAGPFKIWQSVAKAAQAQVYRLCFDVAPTGSGRYVRLTLDDGGDTNAAYAIFDPVTGECLKRDCAATFRFLSIEADPLIYNYKRLVLMAESNAATTVRGQLSLSVPDTPTGYHDDYTGDYAGSVIVCNPKLLEGFDRRDFRWEIGPPEMRFYWTAHLSDMGLRWFRCGQSECGIDPHLRFLMASDLDCVFHRWQPAQDDLVFDYSGALLAGSGDPMAGTP